MANLLLDKPPKSVDLEGVEYPINSDFRTSIRYEILMGDHTKTDEEIAEEALSLFYGKDILRRPDLIEAAINKMIWFYCGGKIESEGGSSRGVPQKAAYSFEYDDDRIYAAFVENFGIDLQEVEYMHWWKFRSLFKTLLNGDKLPKIVEYRVVNASKLPKEQQKYYRDMQEIYKVPEPKAVQKKVSAIEEALMHGEPVDSLL